MRTRNALCTGTGVVAGVPVSSEGQLRNRLYILPMSGKRSNYEESKHVVSSCVAVLLGATTVHTALAHRCKPIASRNHAT